MSCHACSASTRLFGSLNTITNETFKPSLILSPANLTLKNTASLQFAQRLRPTKPRPKPSEPHLSASSSYSTRTHHDPFRHLLLRLRRHSPPGEEYKLFWPEQAEFVRMASRFGATIVPFGVVGEDDIFEVLIDYNDLRKIPFYDLLDKRLNQKDFRVRANSAEEVGNQELHLPGLLPKIPGRFYYLFGKPIETKGLKKVSQDRGEAQNIYLHVKSQVENCISYLKEKREQDPFRNLLPRLLYQVSRGFTEEAPTFEL